MNGDSLAAVLAGAGFIAAEEEAAELLASAGGDPAVLDALLSRRLTGEPLAWITGRTVFCGMEIVVHSGVYVPRWQTELLAGRAARRLPDGGVAVDVCTGSGAIARTLMAARPHARVVGCDVDARSVACAAANGVEVYQGDLLAPLPASLRGVVDVVVAVVPYVPAPELHLLQRDTFIFESTLAYDGGPDGCSLLRRLIAESPGVLRQGGALLLELGGRQADLIAPDLARAGFRDVQVLVDEDGDVRGVEATLRTRR